MNKKWAILIVAAIMAMTYLFLLIGIPALANMVGGNSNSSVTANSSITDVTANWAVTDNWTVVGPDLDLRPIREKYKAPLIIYLTPGTLGIVAIVIILRRA